MIGSKKKYEKTAKLGLSAVDAPVMCWMPCTAWKDLPIGSWLVKIDKDRKPYNVAEVSKNAQGDRMVIVGNHFSWDMGDIIAYTPFGKYEDGLGQFLSQKKHNG